MPTLLESKGIVDKAGLVQALESGALDPNFCEWYKDGPVSKWMTPMREVSIHGDVKQAQVLWEHGAKMEPQYLFDAIVGDCWGGHPQMVKWLLTKLDDPDDVQHHVGYKSFSPLQFTYYVKGSSNSALHQKSLDDVIAVFE